MDLIATIAARARIEGELLLVDEFLNHRVEPDVIHAVGDQLAQRFAAARPDVVLTSEAGGIAPALACAAELSLPMIYAKKYVGPGNRYTYAREVASPTKGTEYRVEVARRVLAPGTRVLIVDDFLSRGRTAEALGDIAEEASCDLVGFGFVIEKTFQGGRRRLEDRGWQVESLVIVESMTDGVPRIKGLGTGTSLLPP